MCSPEARIFSKARNFSKLSQIFLFLWVFLSENTVKTVTRKTGKHLMTGKRRKTPENTRILQENTKEKFIYNVMV